MTKPATLTAPIDDAGRALRVGHTVRQSVYDPARGAALTRVGLTGVIVGIGPRRLVIDYGDGDVVRLWPSCVRLVVAPLPDGDAALVRPWGPDDLA